MSIERDYGQFIPVCDYCGDQLPAVDSFPEAVQAKRDAGWVSREVDGEWEDVCPDCQ